MCSVIVEPMLGSYKTLSVSGHWQLRTWLKPLHRFVLHWTAFALKELVAAVPGRTERSGESRHANEPYNPFELIAIMGKCCMCVVDGRLPQTLVKGLEQKHD